MKHHRIIVWFQGDKGNYRLFVGIQVFVCALWAVATFTGWVNSVTFISHVSMFALVLSTWAMIQAARASLAIEESDSI